MYPQPAGTAVRASLTSIASQSSTLTAPDTLLLNQRIGVAVDELKSMGWPIERIIIRLKEVALEVGFQPFREHFLTVTEIEHREAMWDEAITQCIEQYYR
jgi:hypothetical protein